MSADELDHVDPALGYTTDSWLLQYATCAKLFNHPDQPGTAGARPVPEVVRSYTTSRDGRTYTFELKRTFRFHTGAPVTARSFADAFNRTAQPGLRSPAAPLHARDSGRRRRDRRRGRPHLRDPRPRTVQAANPAREAGRRLHSPADDALLLPDPPEHTRGRDRPSGRFRAVLLRRADHQPADRARAQPVLPRRPPRERRPDRLDARRDPRGMPRGDRGRPRRPLRRAGSSPHRVSGTRREVRPQPARRTALRPTRPRGVVHRLQPRPAGVRRAGADPAQESDQLRDRPA